ncbi:hypothetical protein V8F06_013456 [Rhypophila decipiens]
MADGHPLLRKAATAATFYGYTPFPPLMTFYTDFSGVPFTHVRLCGGGGTTNSKAAADRDQRLYMVDVHPGYTPRGPLHFRPGLYLRNGTTTEAPILAAAGDKDRLPLHALVSTFSLEGVILLPPVDAEEATNPTRDLVTEVIRASTTSTAAAANGMMESTRRVVTFHFAIEVGVKMREREEFEWVDSSGLSSKHTRFVLLRCCSRFPASSSSSNIQAAAAAADDDDDDDDWPDPDDNVGGQVLAELVFDNVISWNRLFSLELKGAGRTGELGDRWALMVVMTALRICWVRMQGKTTKWVVRMGEMVRGR